MAEAALSGEAAVAAPAGGGRKAVGRRTDVAAAAACVAFGVVISILPYLLWWPRLGEPVWLADYDEVYYLQIAGQAYFHHPTSLGDPVVAAPGSRNAYSVVTMTPGVVAARVLGVGPLRAAFFWRVGAGVGCGLLFFLLLRHFLTNPWAAAAVAALLMADVGFLSCHLVLKQWVIAAKVLAGTAGDLLATNPRIHGGWRVMNPGPSLPFLLLHVLLVARARDRPTPLRLGLSGAGFGLLFYVYFYYFTAASLALVLALALDAGHRRVYFHTGWVGGLIGLPAVVATSLFKSSTPPDWLNRTDKFLPIGHFSQLMIPWVACVLLAVGLAWAAARRRDLAHLGLLALAGLGLANNQLATGLQIENFHWGFVWGPLTSLLAVILAAEAARGLLSGSRRVAGALVGLLAIHMGVGLWLRGVEATRTREPVEILADYARYQADRREGGGKPLVLNSVIAGDQRCVHFATILEDQRPLTGYAATLSPYVDNTSWNERIALNAYLLGLGVADFEAEQRRDLGGGHWGPWSRDPAERHALLAKRMAAFRTILGDSRPALKRYGVGYVALPAGRELPAAVRPGWGKVRSGNTWDLFASPDVYADE